MVDLVDGVVNPAPASRRPAAPADATARPHAKAAEDDRRDHRLPDRHRAHLHGRRLAGRRRQGGGRRRCIVETQGSSGSTPLAAATIAGADAVIFATDVGVKDKGRFAGKPVIASGVKRAINEPAKMIAEAVAAADNPNAARVEGSGAAAAASDAAAGDVGWGTRTRQILLTGVSYMIPFVAAGGLLIALGFLFGGYEIANTPDGRTPVARQHHRQHQLADQPARRRFDRSTWARCCSPSAGWRSASWCRRWPATSRSRSPTGPVSHRASPRVRSPSSSAAASSAASSAV